MPRHLHLDFETFSKADIRDVGAYRYAFDPSTEILCAAMAFDDEEPVVWHAGLDEIELMEIEPYWAALADPSVLIYAHNAMFESAICQALLTKTWGIEAPSLDRFHCTMSLARRASLPGKLEKLAEVLKLGNQKDTRGKSLLKKFSMMQPAKKPTLKNPNGLPPRRILPTDEPEAFAELLAYCAQDVRAEQEVARKLAYFDEPINNRNYTLDQRINTRGVPVNLTALRHAQKLIDEETEIVSRKFRELTGFEVTQNAVLLKWVNENGYSFENLQAETVDSFLDEIDKGGDAVCATNMKQWHSKTLSTFQGVNANHVASNGEQRSNPSASPVVTALRLKQSIAYASIKKVKTMLECAGPHDNRIRGTKIHHGCTTGRWSDSLVQFGNMKRSEIKHSEAAYADICVEMDREMFEICNGSVLEVLSSSIRHFCQDYPRNIYDADYAGIEARIVCWLAGQEDALDRFRAYDKAPKGSEEKKALDPYRVMAADVYRIPVREIEPFPHRFVGKGLVLGAGFMLSPAGFRRQCLAQAKYDLPEGEEHHAIGTWRKKHNRIVKWWYALDEAGKNAVLHEGRVYPAGKVSFCCKQIEGMKFLLMKLPSGRKLAYPRPKIVPGKFEGTTQIEYFGNIKGATWGQCRLWPGVMANNSTQGTANDVMFAGAHNCEREGYQIFNVVHDQALSYIRSGQTSERFAELLTTMPTWADGIPLASDGGEAPFYRKS
jgi:DNA polymerase bacteriophage-type